VRKRKAAATESNGGLSQKGFGKKRDKKEIV
jgi:hypothetical protein